MKSDELLRAALYFDVDALTRDPDGANWVRLFQLFPGALRPDGEVGRSAIALAQRGLAAEISGDTARAADDYHALSRRRGLPGLLGALLIAWQADAVEADFERAANRLPDDDPGLAASVHCRLMSWALDQGWRERAHRHYVFARQYAQGDLAEVLARAGDWFDEPTEVRWGYQFTEPDVLCKSAVRATKEAADESLRRSFEESVRSPWTRVIRFGGDVAGLRSAVAAELQASWVGAIWHLPAIRQQYARIALPQQADPGEVSRALGYWVRGSGKDISRIIGAYEGRLTPDALDTLLYDQLHEGRSVKRRSEWTTVCLSLWDQLPESLCLSLINSYVPIAPESPHDERAEEVSLFASLVMRSPAAWGSRVSEMPEEHLAAIVRQLHPTLVKFVPEEVLEGCIRAFLSSHESADPDWATHGWTTVAMMWKRLQRPSNSLTAQLRDAVPESQAAMVALNAEGLVRTASLIRARDAAIATLEKDLSNARKGMFVGWAQNPASELARTVLALRRATKRSISTLVAAANASECSSEQRHAALRALTTLVEEGLARPSVRDIPISVKGTNQAAFQESSAEVRLERISRIALRVRLSAANERTGEILEATRDSDSRVRQVAIAAATWLMANRRQRTTALETAVFGGLYDPEPAVQSDAAEAIARVGLHDDSLNQVATMRIEETFTQMHRDVRAAVARALADRASSAGAYARIHALAINDRSFVVRFSASQALPRT